MNEIEKLYENAEVEPNCTYLFLVDGNGENEAARTISIGSKADLKRLIVDCGVKGKVIKSTNTLKPFYPPFTAEKQLNIVKFLLNKSVYYDTYGDREYWFHLSDEIENSKYREFDEAIAECINKMWKDLRDYEKVQIKEILE